MNGYSRTQIVLHWLIAILIVGEWITGDGMGEALRASLETGAADTPIHVPVGIAVFVLVALRLGLRLLRGAPAPVPGTSPAMEAAAAWGHRLLYALMLAVPLLGMATWFGGIRAAGDVHEVAGNLLMLVALGHALMAIWHQAINRDGTLTRMLRPGA